MKVQISESGKNCLKELRNYSYNRSLSYLESNKSHRRRECN